MGKREPPKGPPRESMRFAGVGLELAATLVGACLLGYWIDRRFDTSPWGLLVCAVVGIVGGLYNMIRRSLHEMVGGAGPRKEGHPGEREGDRRGSGSNDDADI